MNNLKFIRDVFAPEGTLLGPNYDNEMMVVKCEVEDGVWIGYATEADLAEAKRQIRLVGPRSVTEAGIALVLDAFRQL